MRCEFRPDLKKSGRNQIVGSWTESCCQLPDLPFNSDSLRHLLGEGISSSPQFNHQQIAHWCDRMHMMHLDTDLDPQMSLAVSIAADVDCEWDLFLTNSYPLEELQTMDFSKVSMPHEWFADWLEQLDKNK